MTTEVKFRSGTLVQHNAFTGAAAEMTIETDNDRVHVHDGVRAGGWATPNFKDLQDQAMVHGVAGGTANALTVTLNPAPAALVAGFRCSVKAALNNTGAVTLDPNGLGPKAVKKNGGVDALVADDIVANQMLNFEFDGTIFQVTSGTGGAAAGGLVLLASASASASAQVDFTSAIDGTYDTYIIEITDLVPATDNVTLLMRVSQSGTFKAGASDYEHITIGATSAVTPIIESRGSTGDNSMIVQPAGDQFGNAAGESGFVSIRFSSPASASRAKKFHWQGIAERGVNVNGFNGWGIFNLNDTAIDGIRFLMAAGNITSGEFRLYGVAKT